MQEKEFETAVNEFVMQRINAFEIEENSGADEALNDFYCHLRILKGCVKQEYIDFDNSCTVLVGELKNTFYRAGFSNAVTFLLGWRDGTWK